MICTLGCAPPFVSELQVKSSWRTGARFQNTSARFWTWYATSGTLIFVIPVNDCIDAPTAWQGLSSVIMLVLHPRKTKLPISPIRPRSPLIVPQYTNQSSYKLNFSMESWSLCFQQGGTTNKKDSKSFFCSRKDDVGALCFDLCVTISQPLTCLLSRSLLNWVLFDSC